MNPNTPIPPALQKYIKDVEEMQAKQQIYFRTKSPFVLKECKQLEKQVRLQTAGFLSILDHQKLNQQKELFT